MRCQGAPMLVDGRQDHGGGVSQASAHGLLQPMLKLEQGAVVQHLPGKPAGGVLTPEFLVMHSVFLLRFRTASRKF